MLAHPVYVRAGITHIRTKFSIPTYYSARVVYAVGYPRYIFFNYFQRSAAVIAYIQGNNQFARKAHVSRAIGRWSRLCFQFPFRCEIWNTLSSFDRP